MSLARKAVRGAVWTIALSVGSRVFGAITTIAIAIYVLPEVEGEVKAAWLIAFVASTATRFGLDQYLIVKQHDGEDVSFHCTFYMVLLGALSLGAVVLFGDFFAGLVHAPAVREYIPLAVFGVGLRRVAAIPQRILVRDFRFRVSAVAEAGGRDHVWRQHAVAGLSRLRRPLDPHRQPPAGVRVACRRVHGRGLAFVATAVPSQLGAHARHVSFWPAAQLHTLAHVVAHTCDSLAIAGRFDVRAMGLYNKAYNLADIPASHVGEHIGSVLLPSMAKIEPERHIDVLIRSTAILGVLVFPMGVGLSVVAEPLVAVLMPDAWQDMAPFLMALGVMSVFRPLGWVVDSYLKVTDKTRLLFFAELVKVVSLFAAIFLAPAPIWATVGVGLAFALQSLTMITMLGFVDRVSPLRFVPGFIGPVLACAVMAAGVLGARYGLIAVGLDDVRVRLGIEIVVGAVVYVPAAFVRAPAITRDVVGLMRKAFGRG